MLHLYGKLIPTSLLDESGGNAVGVIATYRGDIRLDGYAGQEYHIQARYRSGLWRFYSTGKKFYAVVASTTPKDDALINRFINSFALASPPPAVSQTEPSQPPLKASPERALPAPSSKETWLVILRTFSKSERPKANQRLSILRGFGYDAHIVETDHYPNLKKGFLAVVLGPYSQSVAKSVSDRVHSVAPGAYIKSGW